MGFNLPLYKINVDFISNTQSVEPGTSVSFTNLSGGNPTQYYWNFGNGQTSTQSSPTTTYTTAGTYSVSLMAANENAGGIRLKNDFISVVLPPPPLYISDFATFSGSYYNSYDVPFNGATSWRFSGGNGKLDPTSVIDISTNEDFTVEMFVKQTTDQVYTRLMSIGNHPSKFAFYLSANDGDIFYLSYNNSFYAFSVQTGYLNTWRHYAVVRKDNVIKLYVNGVADAVTHTISASLTTGSEFITIPSLPDGNNGAQGYFSNFRWTKSAVYDGNFTTPTSNLDVLPETEVLLLGPAVDEGTFDVLSGSVNSSSESPYVGGSSWAFGGGYAKFNPSPNFDIPAGSDFTIEMYVKQTLANPYARIFALKNHISKLSLTLDTGDNNLYFWYNSDLAKNFGTQTNYLNNWRHYALVRKNNVWRLYINGVDTGETYTNSAGMTCGSDELAIFALPDGSNVSQGYVSNIRWTLSAVYDGNFTPPSADLPLLTNTKLLMNGPL